MKAKIQAFVIGCTLMAAGLVVDGGLQTGFFICDAEAKAGQPLTPNSVAGVARRTTRRSK
jgi:hypothetical protein